MRKKKVCELRLKSDTIVWGKSLENAIVGDFVKVMLPKDVIVKVVRRKKRRWFKRWGKNK